MQTVRRVLSAVLAIAVLGVAAVACGDDTDTASTGTTLAETTAPPTTQPEASTTPPAAADGAPADGTPEAAAADAYAAVFDSTAGFDAKAPHLEDADSLAPTIDAYVAAAQRFGGISVKPTAVTIDGTTASIIYDLYFGAAKQYGDLTGTIAEVDGAWRVSRAEFCGFMQSARTPCAS